MVLFWLVFFCNSQNVGLQKIFFTKPTSSSSMGGGRGVFDNVLLKFFLYGGCNQYIQVKGRNDRKFGHYIHQA